MTLEMQNAEEIAAGDRFAFGDNWRRFLSQLNESKVRAAEESLARRLGTLRLDGKTFLDVGSGSGLFSLAARRLGATVRSMDYDASSVACTSNLRERFFGDDLGWTVEAGDILDREYLAGLDEYDIVYSWGVVHHTGSMWQACDNLAPLVKPGGQLFIAIYNDRGATSRRWRVIKRTYNRSGKTARVALVAAVGAYHQLRVGGGTLLSGGNPFRTSFAARSKARGMSDWYDLVDWVGGYPFEVASPAAVFAFYQQRGFTLEQLDTTTGDGCNEYVFKRLVRHAL